MKRAYPKKRRNRKTGLSPYVRHAKREFAYSAAYMSWKSGFVARRTSRGA
jgi:hypothetical protein